MIRTISVKDVASYDSEGVVIEDMTKVNFIYGSNGSGKTTISNFINHANEQQYSKSDITWKHDLQTKCVVYNKDFREKNFGKGSIEGVFTLGSATQEDIALIDKKKDELEEIKKAGITKKETLESQKVRQKDHREQFKEDVWKNVYKKYEIDFKEAFKGSMQKETFKDKLLLEHSINSNETYDLEVLLEKSKTIFGEVPKKLNLITVINTARLHQIEEHKVWKEKVIGKSDVDIATLIQKLNINDWVNQGRLVLEDNTTCPFCQQPTITDSFKTKLESYFDDSFVKSTREISDLVDEYKNIAQSLKTRLETIESTEKQQSETKLDIQLFTVNAKALIAQISENLEKLEKKEREPSRSIDIAKTQDSSNQVKEIIGSANNLINNQNSIVDNYESERRSLINQVWGLIASSYGENITNFTKRDAGLTKGIDQLNQQYLDKRNEYRTLDDEIKKLSDNVTSVEPTVNSINAQLKQFGFLNFEIVPCKKVKSHYQLQRQNGDLAENSLSEGEITFITFLYFMQLAVGSKNKNDISDDRVLIIDDPISSLDSTVLFVVSTLIKKIIKDIKEEKGNIKQLVLLTHNVYFHKEVSFINGRENNNRDTSYWILRKVNTNSKVQSFSHDNPIQTSYEMLWKELKLKDHNSGITIQNTMRRIIENYFKILGKYGDDDLIQKFTNIEEQEICRSLICWINDGSHSINDDLYIEQQRDTIEKYMKVFKDIFILTKHEEHYKMMMA